ncbi:hypothetical protein LROSRS0_2559 [Furfurilactobacillus rossiae]|uniref:FeoB-associated Cys-rich membrane protein n=1 Tax=Furfurilactobacillus rossiae DSM 15814 TaxID=1114972 RepID=A0A0R1RKW3_9LACO|nr:FeoB-associated Cys-rich membrane protein [Furfurilactobacillus rossiae]KRL56873.1 hypothetical protein FD35_GL001167 [Furfurilactobacillus rossiae DSM 15814]MCF6165203.1 FeoB-associated Cys-rich membrane protein [Furfurilactobacillus rossiae]QLE62603.1 hypothetical protein LROSRS0_2559 [Furfurilactobacillus rossiae]QLE65318.1 hypothetical protein LROSL1_2518 [Furfurilactobacillus rossiae]
MSVLINVLIFVAIVLIAVIIAVHTMRQSATKPPCESCEYACPARKLMQYRGPRH